MKLVKSDEEPIGASEMIEEARVSYGRMQRSWFDFASWIYKIKSTGAWTKDALGESGYSTFKDFCQDEYPTLNYDICVKFCQIVEKMGKQLESRMKKDKTYELPSYDCCYIATTIREDEIPKEEISRIRKSVLDGKISYHTLRMRLKDVVSKRKAKSVEVDEASLEDMQKGLEEELSSDDLADDSFEGEVYDHSSDTDDEDQVEMEFEDVEMPCRPLISRVDYLLDNLPVYEQLLDGTVTDEQAELGDKLDKLYEIIGNFLNKLEGE